MGEPQTPNMLLGGVRARKKVGKLAPYGRPPPVQITGPPMGMNLLANPNITVNITKKERDIILTETAKKESLLPLLMITASKISLYSWNEMQRIAGNIRVTIDSLDNTSGTVNDPRMGVVSMNVSCAYCSQIDCPGHYGLIDFNRTPIYNPAFVREVVSVLTCVCNKCGGLLLTEEDIRREGFACLSYDKRLAAMEQYCKNMKCLRRKPQIGGGALNPCTKNPKFVTTDIAKIGVIKYKIGGEDGKEVTKDSPQHIMPIETVMDILNDISDDDSRLLGFPVGSHPRNMIMRGLLVIPIIARPPVAQGGTINYDQLTGMYKTIVRKVKNANDGKADAHKDLFLAVRQLIFETENKKVQMRKFISIIERLQGKGAILRGLLMGKRNSDSARTVAGGDPSLRFGQMGVPKIWASVTTKPVKVTNFNIHHLTALLEAGKITHITRAITGLRRFYNGDKRTRLHIGDIVERHLENEDRGVINRQPTLHRQSMMGYKMMLNDKLTIRALLAYCAPKNLDFDGDEMNLWVPQDLEVEAEIEIILNVANNIMSDEQNRPIMGLVMNSITFFYLMSAIDVRINDDLFAELLSLLTHQNVLLTLYSRLTKYGIHPRSGNAIISALLPDDFYYNYKDVLILEGILVSGRLKKAHVGASHRSIIQDLYKKYGAQRTADFISDAPWIANKWGLERGFSVGILDMINVVIDEKTGKEKDRNKEILDEELSKIYVRLEALGGKLQDPLEESYRQRQINNLVNVAQGIGLRLAKDVLSRDNSIGDMSEYRAGTKGGIANIGQMMGSVGQQYYRGERLKPTLTGGRRLLPMYDLDDNSAEANAFIPMSFSTGLTPEALFLLQAGGRENLLDTAMKTSETGSMQHKLIKASENFVISYDGAVVNTVGIQLSPMYNSGYQIGEMLAVEALGRPDFSSFVDIKSLVSELNVARGWVPRRTNDNVINSRRSTQTELGTTEENILPVQNNPKLPRITDTRITYDVTQPVTPVQRPIKMTKFEKARIIGTRATQLSNNAPLLIGKDIYGDEIDPVNLAMMEYDRGLLENLYIVRKFPNGTHIKIHPTLNNI
jgi:DNA-directed RNA polymerase II subunit RPB1